MKTQPEPNQADPATGAPLRHRRLAPIGGLLISLLLAGCQKEEIAVYSAPKDTPPPSVREFLAQSETNRAPSSGLFASAAAPAEPAPQAAAAERSTPKWDVPKGWEQQPATTMLLARFAIKDSELGNAEVTVSAFPGDVGGLLANVNRWRRQIGLPPVSQEGLDKDTSSIEIQGKPATLVEIMNPDPAPGSSAPTRLVVVVLPHEGRTWFYKLTGPDKLADREKPALLKFVESVKY